MKYSTFEELPVWKAAATFALKVFEFTNKADLRGLGDTKNQLERAALSISNNIAEGFERGTTNEWIKFLYLRAARQVNRDLCSGYVSRWTGFQNSNLKFQI